MSTDPVEAAFETLYGLTLTDDEVAALDAMKSRLAPQLDDDDDDDDDATPRFECRTEGCDGGDFYVRVKSSESHDVDEFGVINSEPNRNSFDGEGMGAVTCDGCGEPAHDNQEGKDLTWGD